MGQSWGVAFGRNGVWTIPNNVCMHFDGQDKLVRKVGSQGNNSGQFSYPRCVTFHNDNRFYVADNHRIQKFNVNGNYLLHFGGHGSGDGQLNTPYGITTHNGRVYVADFGNHCIYISIPVKWSVLHLFWF